MPHLPGASRVSDAHMLRRGARVIVLLIYGRFMVYGLECGAPVRFVPPAGRDSHRRTSVP
jgi:hypothetical protein